MRALPTLAALALAVGLAACGGSVADDATDATAPVASADIQTFRFVPEAIEVDVGTTVTWTNRDDTAHTVTAGTADAPRPASFDLPVAGAGDTATVTFDEPGTYAYYCVIHPFMVGTVEVAAG